MKLNKVNGVEFYTFDHFNKTGMVKHCFTTRIGGVSQGCCESLNMSFRKQDRDENVIENTKRICNAVGFDYDGITKSMQVHEINVEKITLKEKGNGMHFDNRFQSADGLVTNVPGIVLTTFYADCVPLYFLDPVKQAIGLAHAGWRGTVGQIGRITVEKMEQYYNCHRKDILVGIGPSIGQCCFEVDTPVKEQFIEKLPFSSKYMLKSIGESDKYYIDLWAVNKQILLNASLKEENIAIADICTKCRPDKFYSHRLTGFERGNMAGMMELMERSDWN